MTPSPSPAPVASHLRPSPARPGRCALWQRACVLGGVLLLGAGMLLCNVGCATVKPYERGIHSKRIMQPDPDPNERKLDTHAQEIREGSTGDPGLRGGGCGCN
jgi:hypothetical protein